MGVCYMKENRKCCIYIYHNGRRIRNKTAARSKAEAKETLKAVEADLMRGELRLSKNQGVIPFSVFCDRYLEYFRANKAGTSYRCDQSSIRNLRKTSGGVPISKITHWQIEKNKRERGSDVKPSSINREISCSRYMLTMAVKWELLDNNPGRYVKLFPEQPIPIKILSCEDKERLLQESKGNPVHHISRLFYRLNFLQSCVGEKYSA